MEGDTAAGDWRGTAGERRARPPLTTALLGEPATARADH